MSVPGRMRANTSAMAEVRVKRGSTWMILAPLARAFWIHFIDMTWFSAALLPAMRKTLLCWRSSQWLVIAPRPNEDPRLGTVGLCQSRAWCSTKSVPKSRAIFWYA